MNGPIEYAALNAMPDVQSLSDARHLAIDQVGIKSLRIPLSFADRDGAAQPTVAMCNLYVALPEDRKGTHMSRLVQLLEERTGPDAGALTVGALRSFMDELVARLDAPAGRLELAFPFFVRKNAPISGVASLLDYEVRLIAELAAGSFALTLTVVVPVTSLCPSSKEISGRGAHNQRSTITISVQAQGPVFLTELVQLAESEASSELYGILKRADEKYVTERAYDNPRFVEDLARGVAARLAADPRFPSYCVEAENFESIHNHSAYARIARGPQYGQSR